MRAISKVLPKLMIAVLANCILISAVGQDAASVNKAHVVNSSGSSISFLMILIAIILGFVLLGMGQVLVALGRQVINKQKAQGKTALILLMPGLSLLSFEGYAQEIISAEPAQKAFNYGGLNSTAFWMLATVIILELTAIVWIMFLIKRLQSELLPEKHKRANYSLKSWWSILDKKFFTKATAIEKEQDVLLDHEYDGIRELDNSLPPWWKYGFWITIVVAFVYMFNFHVFDYGKNPTEEYAAEMKKAHEAKLAHDAKNANIVNENNIQMPSAAGIASGREIYLTTCYPCHGKAGEGGAGPNLADDYWLHKGSLSDIYKSIKSGYPDKGMQAWEKNYSSLQIVQLAGFIKTLKGTNPPNAKAPQGNFFTDEAIADSTEHTSSHPGAAGKIIPRGKK